VPDDSLSDLARQTELESRPVEQGNLESRQEDRVTISTES